MTISIEIVRDPAASCAELLAEVAGRGGHIVLTGGSTPKSAYEHAAAGSSGWAGAHLWFGDERAVPPDDDRSNYLMAKRTLIDGLAKRGQRPEVHRMRGELGAERGADAYESELREAGSPRFDLLLLGVGPDGHTASLFPGKPALEERERRVVGVPEAGLEPFVPRITLTFAELVNAERIVYLIAGAAKAEIVERVFGADGADSADRADTPLLPAQILMTMTDRITLLTDAAAAARL